MKTLTNPQNEISFALAAAVATSGTITVAYPTGTGAFNGAGFSYGKGDYTYNNGQHKLVIGQNVYTSPKDFTLIFNANASGITVTNKGTTTWPQGATVLLQINPSGAPAAPDSPVVRNVGPGTMDMQLVGIDLGSPTVGAANNVAASQAVATAKNLTINGTLAVTVNGTLLASLDCPRTLQFVSSNAGDTTQTATINGYDEYGAKVTETVTLNGTTIVTSKKAMVAIISIAISAALAGNITVGTSNTLGLPIALWKSGQILKELQDGAAPTAGTTVAAVQLTQTATTGDVRGTYIPNGTLDGTIGLLLIVAVPDASDIGVPQFSSF